MSEYDHILECKIPKYLERLPNHVLLSWCKYKGETVVADVNWEKSLRAHRPIINIHYCMTKALNGIILETVNYKAEHFSIDPLTY